MSEPEPEYRYYAFISYRHVEPDQTWARWLHSSIETYRVPGRLVRERNLPERIRPLFRDEEELSASADLSESIKEALRQSRFLIVVCSPNAPGSKWVNKEILAFREMGREENILSLLVGGEPADSFPPALREVGRRRPGAPDAAGEAEAVEPLAADVRPKPGASASHVKRMAKLRIVARILGCEFDELRRRDRERKTRTAILAGAASLLLVAALAGLAYYGFGQRNEALHRGIDVELATDAAGTRTPFDVERWHRLDALLKRAGEAGYRDGASEIAKRLSCLAPPGARRADARVEDLPEKFLVNNDGTRVCAIYTDRLEIRDARTYEALHTFRFPRPLRHCETLYVLADSANDRVVYTVDSVTLRCDYSGFPRQYYVKSYDASPPRRLTVSPQFEGYMPGGQVEQGIRLRLRLLSRLTSRGGELDERPEVIERLRQRLGLDGLSRVVRVDFDPATGLGMYRVYTLERQPEPPGGVVPSRQSVFLYDGESRLIRLEEGVDARVATVWPDRSGFELVIMDYHASLNAEHRLALLGNKLFRFSDGGEPEVIDLGLPLDKILHLEISPDGEGVFVEFNDEEDGPNSLGLYRPRQKTLHRVFPFDVVAQQHLQPAAKQVWTLSKDKRLEAWDISAFQPNGWAASACPAR
jgi:hypothetical protein